MDDEDDKPRGREMMPPDLSPLSVAELDEWIATMEGEIARARAAIAAKRAVQTGAEALFGRKDAGR